MVMADVERIEVVSSLRKRLPDLPVIAISSEALYLDYVRRWVVRLFCRNLSTSQVSATRLRRNWHRRTYL